ncbi:MAG: hypothetical protein ACR2QZ_16505 [Woeseiaceae bacterium]
MRTVSIALLAVAVLLTTVATTDAADRVREFKGTGNTTTAIFNVESPWVLDWRLDGDFDELVALDVTLVEANTGKHIGRVLHTKRKGNGVKLFKSGGRYQLRISSSLARWTIKIDQLTPEEAELYTPRGRPGASLPLSGT